MLSAIDKPESPVRAALIVRDKFGELMDPQPTSPILIDAESEYRERLRLYSVLGPNILIDDCQLRSAREYKARRDEELAA